MSIPKLDLVKDDDNNTISFNITLLIKVFAFDWSLIENVLVFFLLAVNGVEF